MVTIRKYAGNITQKTGQYIRGTNYKSYRTFTNLNNLKNDSNTYATCSNISAKSGTYNRPSTLSFKNFGFNIPSYAKITKIVVGYSHNKITYSSNPNAGHITINAPLITLLNLQGYSTRGYAVPIPYSRFTKTYNANPTPAQVNNSNFGVSIDYPTNTSSNNGAMKIGYCWIEITYTDLNFSINTKTVNNTEKYVGDSFDIEINLKNLSKTRIDYNSQVNISLPAGLIFESKVSGRGDFNKVDDNNYKWISSMGDNFESNVIMRVKCLTTGSKSIIFTESSTNITTRLNTTISEDKLNLDIIKPDFVVEDEEFILNIKASTLKPRLNTTQVYIQLPAQLIVNNFETNTNEDIFDENNNRFVWLPDTLTHSDDVLKIYITPTQSGLYNYNIGTHTPFTAMESYSLKVKPKSLTTPFFSKYTIPEEIKNRLGDNLVYTIISYIKMNILESDINLVEEYEYNYRLGIFNEPIPEDPAEFTNEYILSNCEFSDAVIEPNTLKEVTLSFKYNELNPLIIIFTGEYIESDARAFSIQYSNPIMVESEFFNGIENPGLFPAPIRSLISNDDFGVTELLSLEKSNRIRLYDYVMGGLETKDDLVIQGLTIHFNVNSNNACSLLVKIIAPNGKTGERSLNIGQETDEKMIGGKFDLCGLDFEDYKDLDNLQIELVQLNPFDHDTYLEINNIHLTFHYIDIPTYNTLCWVNGVDCRYYNMFIENIEIPAGTENDVKYLQVSGTDSNVAYRSNIDSKEVTILFHILGCDLEETTLFLERIAKLFRNERDELNKPIPNTLEVSHYPNRVWEFVQEGAIEAKSEFTNYEGEIELVIPSGTSRSKEAVVTNASGINDSIAKINPIIDIMPFEDEITIIEEISNQSFILRKTDLKNANIIKVNCMDRKVSEYIKNEDGTFVENDITNAVDFESDWFIIQGEYRFTCGNGASIQSVQFYERW